MPIGADIERGAAVVLKCAGCGEPIVILPPLVPRRLESMLPALMAALGAPMPKRDIDGVTGEPTMFGMRGEELSVLMKPRCYSCAVVDPQYSEQLALAATREA